jgi:hypothetical protein
MVSNSVRGTCLCILSANVFHIERISVVFRRDY